MALSISVIVDSGRGISRSSCRLAGLGSGRRLAGLESGRRFTILFDFQVIRHLNEFD